MTAPLPPGHVRPARTAAEFDAMLARVEAAPWAEEACIERVARAIHAADEMGNYPPRTWNDEVEGNREDYRILAAAAVDALAGPAGTDAP